MTNQTFQDVNIPRIARQQTFFLNGKIEKSIECLKAYCPEEGYYLCHSFGKDSCVLYALALMAGVKCDSHFHRSTVDPPELLSFGREFYSDVTIEKPPDSMFKLIRRQGIPPTRRMRYCCRIFKEEYGVGRIVLTGVRAQESRTRADRQMVSQCPRMSKIIVNPIVDWTEIDVWDFLYAYEVPYSPLYDEGCRRLGCIGCPAAYFRTRIAEFERWPKFFRAYLRCFDQLIEEKERTWKSGEEVMRWWMEESRWKAHDHKQFESLLDLTGGGK